MYFYQQNKFEEVEVTLGYEYKFTIFFLSSRFDGFLSPVTDSNQETRNGFPGKQWTHIINISYDFSLRSLY